MDYFSIKATATLTVVALIAHYFLVRVEYSLLFGLKARLSEEHGESRGKRAAEGLLDNAPRYLHGLEFAISITRFCLILGSSILFYAFSLWLVPKALFATIPETIQFKLSYGRALLCLLSAVVLQVALVGSLPKFISIQSPELFLLKHWKPLTVFSKILAFPNICIRTVLKPLLTILNIPEDFRLHSHYLASEIPHIFAEGNPEAGEEERAMIRGVVGFSDTVAREVMTPRTDIESIEVDSSLEEVLSLVLKTGFSRFPVSGASHDDIRGVLLIKDLLPVFAQGAKTIEDFSVREHMRPAFFVPDTKPIDDLLAEFKSQKQHMAVVLDEHGGVDGIVTLEDLVEELVGDIFDESDHGTPEVSLRSNGELFVDGGALVSDLNDDYGLQIPEAEEYDTIAGFIFTLAGRVPKQGDVLELDTSSSSEENLNGSQEESEKASQLLRITVSELDGQRISNVIISKQASSVAG